MEENEYIFQAGDTELYVKSAVLSPDNLRIKRWIECPECGELAEVDTSVVLTSIPPRYKWNCEHCHASGSVQCEEAKFVDPAIWYGAKARFATKCEICGDEILIYGDERPRICKDCKCAVIAMRRALGTWKD